MNKRLLAVVLQVFVSDIADARGFYGLEYLQNPMSYRYEEHGVKVRKDSSLIELGDLIYFEIRGLDKIRNGILEVFFISLNENKNKLYINGYDAQNKVNRMFVFPYR